MDRVAPEKGGYTDRLSIIANSVEALQWRFMMATVIANGVLGPQIVLIDDEDFNRVKVYPWLHQIRKSTNQVRRVRCSKGCLGKFVLNYHGNLQIDHINGNPLDNRKQNLRLVTVQQNAFNRKRRRDCNSQFKGVHLCASGKYRVRIGHSKQINLGTYSDELSAAKAYNKAAKELFGEHACTNF
jgi:hypothetical protein